MKVKEKISNLGIQLTSYKGSDLIDRLGAAVVNEAVSSILCGANVRSLTESLTRRRIALSNASLLATYLDASNSITDFSENMSSIIGEELSSYELPKEEKKYLQWLVGLTGKSVQNILRDNSEEVVSYLNELEIALQESAGKITEIYGDLTGSICLKDKATQISWPVITQIFMAIGAQTLSIRGSEKSIYGKLFEKFILGSLLSILGFDFVKREEPDKKEKIFWLSGKGEKRESDAILLLEPGKGISFDIGFIGPGNPEISLDKVSRFAAEMKHGKGNYFMKTLIIVDRVGEGSRIFNQAEEIGGTIVQMSMAYWVKEVAKIISASTKFEHDILKMTDSDSIQYIKDKMQDMDLKKFM